MLNRAASGQHQASCLRPPHIRLRNTFAGMLDCVSSALVSEHVTFPSAYAKWCMPWQPPSDAQFKPVELTNTALSPRNASHSCSGCARASARPSQQDQCRGWGPASRRSLCLCSLIIHCCGRCKLVALHPMNLLASASCWPCGCRCCAMAETLMLCRCIACSWPVSCMEDIDQRLSRL